MEMEDRREELLKSVQQLPCDWAQIIRFDENFHIRFSYSGGDRGNEDFRCLRYRGLLN